MTLIRKIMKDFYLNGMIKFALLLLMVTGVMAGNQSFCQSRESLVKAGYIEKFTRFVEWPETSAKSEPIHVFTIAVIGENTFGSDLDNLFSKTKIKNSRVQINYISSVDEIGDCMLLFISGSEKNNLANILQRTTGKPILTISDSKGFGVKGVIINMFQEGEYIRYEINRSALQKSGLIINSLLLNSAVIIK